MCIRDRSYLEVDFLHDANTSIDMEVKLPEAIVPKVGHGPKMGHNRLDCSIALKL